MSTNHEGALPVQDVIRVSYDSEKKATIVRTISGDDGASLLCVIPDGLKYDESIFGGFRGRTMGWMDAPDSPDLRLKIKFGVTGTVRGNIEQRLIRAWSTMNDADYREFHKEVLGLLQTYSPDRRPEFIA